MTTPAAVPTTAITWFEIPATDFDRAVTFYETILKAQLHREMFGDDPNAVFPYVRGQGTGGAVVKVKYAQSGAQGTVVYLNAQTPDNLDHILSRVEAAGGTVLMPKTHAGRIGYIALIRDTEGNQVGLHTPA